MQRPTSADPRRVVGNKRAAPSQAVQAAFAALHQAQQQAPAQPFLASFPALAPQQAPTAASDAAPQADDSLLINEPLAVAGEHGVFGYIDRDHQFILVAPVIASADGPDVEAPPGVTAVHLKWTWNPISLKTPEEAPDMPPSWTLRRFGEKSNHALLPASSSNATLRLPGAYRIRRLVRAPVRNDNSTWLVFVFSTNLTAPEQAAVVHRPRDTKQKLDEEALFFGDQTSEADFRLSKA